MPDTLTVYTKDGTPVAATPLRNAQGNVVLDGHGNPVLAPAGFDINKFSDGISDAPYGFKKTHKKISQSLI